MLLLVAAYLSCYKFLFAARVMAFQVCQFVLFTALLFPSLDGITKSEATKPSKHGEVHRAKSEIDSLIYKLTLDLKTLNEKETKAEARARVQWAMRKDASKLALVAKEEIALLRSVQYLLEKLAKGNSSNGYERCMAWPGGKIPIQIKALSPLPKHFTISVPGKTSIFIQPSMII